jgi:hypothetical protein
MDNPAPAPLKVKKLILKVTEPAVTTVPPEPARTKAKNTSSKPTKQTKQPAKTRTTKPPALEVATGAGEVPDALVEAAPKK